ncbi:MAG: acyltransferase [Anaerolineae bacterium]|nr:acyltransferase [Anaerolineae bacterium]
MERLLYYGRGVRNKLYTAYLRPKFKSLQSVIPPGVDITNPQHISIGRNVRIAPYTWLYAITNDGERKNIFQPSIEIGDGCVIGRFCYITASNRLVLEERVFVMRSVLITDSSHGHEDLNVAIIDQPLISQGPVIIGTGSWIGTGARIMGRVRIGRNCVVGTNAVVNKDVPDYCVVAGVPARIVKRYDMDAQAWIRVDEPLGSCRADAP